MLIDIAKHAQVLVIDDQMLVQGYLKYALQELGFNQISYTEQADVATSRIKERDYDLILCAYNLRKDQEGLELYRRLKANGDLARHTAFIFISADTSADIVQSIVEMQPDGFLVKPFSVKTLRRRLSRVLKQKRALKETLDLMDQQQFERALDSVESLLTNPAESEHYPTALQLKGKLLMLCQHYNKAHDFYQAIINVQKFAWAQLGKIDALRHLGKHEEAEKNLLRLALKPDAQVVAFDLLSDIKVQQQDFDMALESTLMAAEISPRNIQRQQKALTLSRLTHDYEAQWQVSKDIVKFSRHTVNEQPNLYLNVARAGVDFAIASDDANTPLLLAESSEYITRYRQQYPKQQSEDEINVIQARILYLQNEKVKARALINDINEEALSSDSMDALLDKAKAFHELGLYDNSMQVLDEIERRAQAHPEQGDIFIRYIRQERREKQQIRKSSKELNNEAVNHYQRGDLEQAIQTFRQAFQITPKSPSIALNLLQSITFRAQKHPLKGALRDLMEKCVMTIENNSLNDEQKERYQRIQSYLQELM